MGFRIQVKLLLSISMGLANTDVKRVGADAWSLMYSSIPDKLRKLHDEGYKLVIFTNESNIERWTKKRQVAVDSKIGRLNSFIKLVNLPIQVFIACGFDKSGKIDPYRKPQPGMWRVMEQHFNSGIPVDMDCSFYVGDAAGRPNDHSSADIKFAEIRDGRFQGVGQCLVREYRMICHELRGEFSKDFFEGCRAILIDKDKNPKWEPSRLDLVNDSMVNRYFQRVNDEAWTELKLPMRSGLPASAMAKL